MSQDCLHLGWLYTWMQCESGLLASGLAVHMVQCESELLASGLAVHMDAM